MTAYLIYIIKWALALTALYSLYGLFLRKETFHGLNRKMLLGILMGSMALPFCQLTHENNLGTMVQHIEQNISMEAARLDESAEIVSGSPAMLTQPSTEAPSLWFLIPLIIYMAGLAYFWGKQFMAYASLCRLIQQGKCADSSNPHGIVGNLPSGIRLILNDRVQVPCSWMHWILVSTKDMAENGQMVIRHESEHIRRHHSWDMLLCDFTVNMLWFLPFAHLLRKDLSDVHEYQADRAVMQSDVDQRKYHQLLIDKATIKQPTAIANSLNASEVKNRLTMMFRKESSRLARLKVLYVLPLLGIVLMAFARPNLVEEVRQVIAQEEVKTEAVIEEVVAPIVAPQQKKQEATDGAHVNEASQHHELEATGNLDEKDSTIDAAHQQTDEEELLRARKAEERRRERQKGPMAEDGLPIFYDLPLNTNSDILYSGIRLERRNHECLVHLIHTIEQNDEVFYAAGEDTYLYNPKTHIYYKCRGINIGRAFDTEFHVCGMRGKTVDITLIFPPIPEDYDYMNFVSVGMPRHGSFNLYKSDLESSK